MKVLSICLKLYRQSRNISIRDCAKEIGVSSATLSRIENDKETVTDSFIKVLNWLNCTEKCVPSPIIMRQKSKS